MNTIDRHELSQMIERGDDFALVEVLPPDQYEKSHLPGAINVPLDEQFDAKIQRAIPRKDCPVVVYCANTQCTASPKAARKLVEMGYQHVFDYEAGKQDWMAAGLGLKGQQAAHPAA